MAMMRYKNVGYYQQKKFFTLSGFWLLKVLGESVKKGKFVMKMFFQIMLNKILKNSKNDICWCKADVKQPETKELVAVSCNFL